MVQISLYSPCDTHTYIFLLRAYCNVLPMVRVRVRVRVRGYSARPGQWNTYKYILCRPLVAHTDCNLQRKSEEKSQRFKSIHNLLFSPPRLLLHLGRLKL